MINSTNLVKELFSKTDQKIFHENNEFQAKTRIYFPSYELKNSKGEENHLYFQINLAKHLKRL
jgi:hypothetical protein